MYRFFCLPISILVASPLLAQSSSKSEVFPASMARTEGLGGTPYPFGVSRPCRMQALYETVEERGPTRIAKELHLRGDWVNPMYSQKAKAWADMGIVMSHSNRGFATASSTFASNRGMDQTNVFKIKKVAFPAQPRSKTGPRPFNIIFKFDRPFIRKPNAGNLLVEFIILTQPAGSYRLDSTLHCLSQSSSFGKRGNTCFWKRKTSKGTENVFLRLRSSVSIKLGNTVDWRLEDAPPKSVALFILGNDPKYAKWGPLPVPIDLGPFGAPGCYVNTDILMATVATTDTFGVAVSSFVIPQNYAFLNQYLHTQALVPDYSANKVGLVFSLGRKAQICGPITATRILAIGDVAAEKGSVLFGDAPVIQLIYQ